MFYGAQTLRQLLPPAVFRQARARRRDRGRCRPRRITDAPRFGWRGCLLDVARHFLPKADVLRFIDLLALHKLNVLHLHLTDDQGWRLEVPRWPRLTEVGAWRRAQHGRAVAPRRRTTSRPHGGYYTPDDIREIVAYAADRHVTVVPEVDMPGHMRAAIAAYPELGNTGEPLDGAARPGASRRTCSHVSDTALRFCRDVLDDVLRAVRQPVRLRRRRRVPDRRVAGQPGARRAGRRAGPGRAGARCSRWFTAQLADHLAERGRRLLGWDEILDGGAPAGATIAAWRGPQATLRAVAAGHDVVACPDDVGLPGLPPVHRPGEPIPVGSLLTLEDVYAFSPYRPAPSGGRPGPRACRPACGPSTWTPPGSWTTWPSRGCARWPRWPGRARPRVDDFNGRMRLHQARLRASGVEYRHDSGPLPWQTRPDARGWPR